MSTTGTISAGGTSSARPALPPAAGLRQGRAQPVDLHAADDRAGRRLDGRLGRERIRDRIAAHQAIRRRGASTFRATATRCGSASPRDGPVGPAEVHVVRFIPSDDVSIEAGENAGQSINYSTSYRLGNRGDLGRRDQADLRYEALDGGPVAVIVQQGHVGPSSPRRALPDTRSLIVPRKANECQDSQAWKSGYQTISNKILELTEGFCYVREARAERFDDHAGVTGRSLVQRRCSHRYWPGSARTRAARLSLTAWVISAAVAWDRRLDHDCTWSPSGWRTP